ncbi:conserved hypothetical protein [Aspergillus terreus NIH2624]|uniref:MARVEL domain-containing protein n=1 Tax=Aspergillus terreus (strain NIH 2624 / FGSC A1156) TaxID=341663 RepID=Q0CFV3_ASPTN|nr:uncharacterized protein ATEG_07431 [Aspergillus terreus NIH2624]EAU31693.1 conserved hypothetical protein [Aspergillus terreus NIH2624]
MDPSAYIVRDTHRAVVSLRIVAGISSLAALVAFGWSQNNFDNGEVLVEDLGAPVISPVVGILEYTLIWSLLAVSIRLSSQSPIHPAIYVTFDCIAWAGLLAITILYLALMSPYYSGDGYSCPTYTTDCIGKTVANVEHFGTAMALLAVIIHFGLFVWACRIADKFRKSVSKSGHGHAKGSNAA